jgi:GDP-L-fucose synthase
VSEIFSLKGKRVWVAGHRGMVGSAVVRRLQAEDCEILTVERSSVDLRDQQATWTWMRSMRPEVVVVAAAKVGGILANHQRPAEFLCDNLFIESNIIQGAHDVGVEKLLFLGSSCIYPKFASQPISESELLTGSLEPTNEWYAVAKIAGIKLCQAFRRQFGRDFISAMPTNLYGPGDNFDLQSSHVLPALMRKVHEAVTTGAKEVVIWGSGTPRREFLYVDDCADGIVFLLRHYSGEEHVNLGTGQDVTIAELASHLGREIGFTGEFVFDRSKPDGTPRKLLDVRRLRDMGWTAATDLETGIRRTYEWYLEQANHKRGHAADAVLEGAGVGS